MKTPVLTPSEAKVFLTEADLKSLSFTITDERLQAIIADGRSPYVVVRGKYVPLFTILEMLGTL